MSCSNQNYLRSQAKAKLYYTRGTHHLIQKEYSRALKFLLKAHEQDLQDSKILNNLGMSYYFKKQYLLAQKYLQKAIDNDPKNIDALNNMASLHLSQGKKEEAKILYGRALKDLIYTQQHRIYYNMALIDIEEGHIAKAIVKLKKAYDLKKDYCTANYKLGKIYYKRHNYKEALLWFNNAQQGECYSHPLPRYNYALTLATLGKYKEAIVAFQNIVESFPRSQVQKLAKIKMQEIASLDLPLYLPRNDKLFHSPTF